MNSDSACVFCDRLQKRRPGKSMQSRRCPVCDGELLHDNQNGESYRIDGRPRNSRFTNRHAWIATAAIIMTATGVVVFRFTRNEPIPVTINVVKVARPKARPIFAQIPIGKATAKAEANYHHLTKAKRLILRVTSTKPVDPEILKQIRRENPPSFEYAVAKTNTIPGGNAHGKSPFPIAAKKLERVTEKDWEKSLLAVPEIGLDENLHSKLFQEVAAQQKNQGTNFNPIEAGKKIRKTILAKNADWKYLPWLKDGACKITPKQATILGGVSTRMRSQFARIARVKNMYTKQQMAAAVFEVPFDASHGDSLKFKKQLASALPAFHQIFMAEPTEFRHILVDYASSVPGKTAIHLLAKRAIFDPDEELRQSAVTKLNHIAAEDVKVRKDYHGIFIKGLQYPMPIIAQNAAVALAKLNDASIVPKLIELLKTDDPTTSFAKAANGEKQPMVREVVRINHLRNCLVCHAPMAVRGNPVPGFIPSTQKPLPPPTQAYYGSFRSRGIFVRADITYLRQQFSVMLPVQDHGKWPKMQRFDFLVRERPGTKAEIADWKEAQNSKKGNPYQQRVVNVVQQITGLKLAANAKALRAAVSAWRRQLEIVGKNSKRK